VWLDHHRERLTSLNLIKRQRLRVITNRDREGDGNEEAGALFVQWLRSTELFAKTPCLLYCADTSRVSHVHNPRHHTFVSANSAFALQFVADCMKKS